VVSGESFTIARNVGRLVEVRVLAPLSVEDLQRFPLQLSTEAGQDHVVACADMRGLNLLPPGLSDAFAHNLRRESPMVLRSAFLLPKSAATLKLQMSRLTREVGGADRRVFDDPLALHQWLAELLTPDEAKRLALFLSGK
jgi:hypothetical protein